MWTWWINASVTLSIRVNGLCSSSGSLKCVPRKIEPNQMIIYRHVIKTIEKGVCIAQRDRKHYQGSTLSPYVSYPIYVCY